MLWKFIHFVTYYVKGFANMRKQTGETKHPRVKKWEAPPDDMYKINIDAAFTEATRRRGWGFIARDSASTFLE